MKKILWRAGVLVHREETGGEHSRTIRMEIGSGRVFMKVAGSTEQQIGFQPEVRNKERTPLCATS
jgi:chemotaxis receptor (MCP) glutamine deamidase CheD